MLQIECVERQGLMCCCEMFYAMFSKLRGPFFARLNFSHPRLMTVWWGPVWSWEPHHITNLHSSTNEPVLTCKQACSFISRVLDEDEALVWHFKKSFIFMIIRFLINDCHRAWPERPTFRHPILNKHTFTRKHAKFSLFSTEIELHCNVFFMLHWPIYNQNRQVFIYQCHCRNVFFTVSHNSFIL